jgi:protocatechuate 4,5-dioxygenase alpha chain
MCDRPQKIEIPEHSMSSQARHDWGIADTYVFDGGRSKQGYRLNKMCHSLCKPENRKAFLADEDGYMSGYGLSDEEKKAVRERDWLKTIQLGGNIYFVMKLGACVKQGLYVLGAQQRGETLEEFLKTRNVGGAT